MAKRLIDQATQHVLFAPAVPSSANPAWVSLKGYDRVTFTVHVTNSTGVTGSAVTLEQATTVAGAGSKSLPFTRYFRAEGTTVPTGALSEATTTTNAFTTSTTNNARCLYVLEVKADDLDVTNNYDCVRVALGNATAATVGVIATVHGPSYNVPPGASAVVD